MTLSRASALRNAVKVIQPIYSVCAIALLVTGCSSGLDRSREEAANARAGVVVSVAKSGVEMRMPEATLFDSEETAVRPDSVAILDRTAVLLKRSTVESLKLVKRPARVSPSSGACVKLTVTLATSWLEVAVGSYAALSATGWPLLCMFVHRYSSKNRPAASFLTTPSASIS